MSSHCSSTGRVQLNGGWQGRRQEEQRDAEMVSCTTAHGRVHSTASRDRTCLTL